jgi:cobalt-zinc-cadmium efflux system membrane fusion protein
MNKATYILMIAPLVVALGISGCGKAGSDAAAGKSAEKEMTEDRHAEGEKHEDKDGAESGVLKLTAEAMQTAGIKVAIVDEQIVSQQLTLTATIRANQDRIAHIVPRVPGRITKVGGNLGDAVLAGQTLALIDSIELGEAHSAYLQARSQHDVARADFDRAERLRKDEIIPEKDYLRARSEFEKARAASQAAADKLRMLGIAQSSMNSISAISVYPLAVPFAGTVIEKKAVLGELAKTDDSLFTVADLSTVWIEANLFEQDLSKARIGATAQVTVTAYPGEIFKGRLTYISSTLDKETRAVPVRIEVRNADGRLKPEMFATASIDTGGTAKGLLIPQDAVVLMQGQPTVFVEEHGGFEQRAIESAPGNSRQALVKSGLKPGERVVVAGAYAIKAQLLKSQLGSGHGH